MQGMAFRFSIFPGGGGVGVSSWVAGVIMSTSIVARYQNLVISLVVTLSWKTQNHEKGVNLFMNSRTC